MECEYCEHIFGSERSLINHQKTAKYCIILRGDELTTNFTCKYCTKVFTRKDIYNHHSDICIIKLKHIIDRKNRIINKYIKSEDKYKKKYLLYKKLYNKIGNKSN